MVRIGSVCLLGFIAQGVRTGAPANALQAPRICHGGGPAEFARIGGVTPMTIDGGLADLPAHADQARDVLAIVQVATASCFPHGRDGESAGRRSLVRPTKRLGIAMKRMPESFVARPSGQTDCGLSQAGRRSGR
jgi:hypothetical protein